MRLLEYKQIFIILILGSFISCGGSDEPETKPAPPLPAVETQEIEEEEEPQEIPVYVYSGDRFRDPFSPVGLSTSYVPDAVFDPQRATLKAVIVGPSTKGAILIISGSGSYFIKAGRIFDIMGKTVEGFRAMVQKDRVIITGEVDDQYVLKIRETEEETIQ